MRTTRQRRHAYGVWGSHASQSHCMSLIPSLCISDAEQCSVHHSSNSAIQSKVPAVNPLNVAQNGWYTRPAVISSSRMERTVRQFISPPVPLSPAFGCTTTSKILGRQYCTQFPAPARASHEQRREAERLDSAWVEATTTFEEQEQDTGAPSGWEREDSGFQALAHAERAGVRGSSSSSKQPSQNSAPNYHEHNRAAHHSHWAGNERNQAPTNLSPEAKLRQKYGSHAKLVVRRINRAADTSAVNQHVGGVAARASHVPDNAEEDLVAEEEGLGAHSKSDGMPTTSAEGEGEAKLYDAKGGGASCAPEHKKDHFFRASATFRLLGFPVELAADSGETVEEVEARVLARALSSDIPLILPGSTFGGNRDGFDTQPNRQNQRGGAQRRRTGQNHRRQQHLTPREMELKAVVDELRDLCIHFSRTLKFSIKDNTASTNPHVQKWKCRAYMRDEWGATTKLVFTLESRGDTPNGALLACFATLRDRYKEELTTAAVMLESVREVQAVVRPYGRRVDADCVEDQEGNKLDRSTKRFLYNLKKMDQKLREEAEASTDDAENANKHRATEGDSQAATEEGGSILEQAKDTVSLEEQYFLPKVTTYTSTIVVDDQYGNTSMTQLRKQPTPLIAYESVSWQAIRAERALFDDTVATDEFVQPPPLLLRLRWQLNCMAQAIADLQDPTGKTPGCEIARVDVESASASPDESAATEGGKSIGESSLPYFFTAVFRSEGQLTSQVSGLGRYRVEFDCYVQAVSYLLDQYPEIGQAYCARVFPTARMLELAVWKHDNFNVIGAHKGNWNCYSVLGTLTSNLIGHYYQTTYREDVPGKPQAILTVNDGMETNKYLIARQSTKRGDAWKSACLAAIKENFPKQFLDAVSAHPDLDISGDPMARGSKYRALPREKRVRYMSNLFALVTAFAEEDLGWRQMRIRLRNCSGDLGLPMWIAEMEAQVENEEQRRVVAVTPPFSTSKHARRVLIYELAKEHFPAELKAYADCGHLDASNPDKDDKSSQYTQYKPGVSPFVSQVLQLVALKQPSLGTITWSLEREYSSESQHFDNDGSVEDVLRPLHLKYRARVCGQHGDALLAERVGGVGESAVNVLRSVLKAVCDEYGGDDGEILWSEYETHLPPFMGTSRDLCVYLFNSFFGFSKTGDVRSVDEETDIPLLDTDVVNYGDFWFATVVLPRSGAAVVARAMERNKKDAVRDALFVACRESFARQLHFLSKQMESSAFAEEIINAQTVSVPDEAIISDIRSSIARSERQRHKTAYRLLCECVRRDYTFDRTLRTEITSNTTSSSYVCRLFLQRKTREVKKGDAQLIGYASALGRLQALHAASIMALESVFEEDLKNAIAQDPSFTDLPPLSSASV